MSTLNSEQNGGANLPPSYQQHIENGDNKNLHMNENPTNEYVLVCSLAGQSFHFGRHITQRSSSHHVTFTLTSLQNVAFFSFFGFMLVQAGFALMVGSQSMLADSEAMGVDSMTYLFNLCAERIKNRPYSSYELELPANVREYKRTLKRLYLELIPPLISVSTLIAVTIVTLHDSLQTLFGNDNDANDQNQNVEGDEMVGVMLFFSTLNLLLDVVNVTCFARADQAYVHVLQSQNIQEEFKQSLRSQTPSQDLSLLVMNAQTARSCEAKAGEIEVEELHGYGTNGASYEGIVKDNDDSQALVNLNMCSAWTVSLTYYNV